MYLGTVEKTTETMARKQTLVPDNLVKYCYYNTNHDKLGERIIFYEHSA